MSPIFASWLSHGFGFAAASQPSLAIVSTREQGNFIIYEASSVPTERTHLTFSLAALFG
ncbi:MAG: hypothetical protein HY540_05625 [Deltaproteobacteria bacterium]|nr:hypothetical protein [Deltaproteobacteria bacterium]